MAAKLETIYKIKLHRKFKHMTADKTKHIISHQFRIQPCRQMDQIEILYLTQIFAEIFFSFPLQYLRQRNAL